MDVFAVAGDDVFAVGVDGVVAGAAVDGVAAVAAQTTKDTTKRKHATRPTNLMPGRFAARDSAASQGDGWLPVGQSALVAVTLKLSKAAVIGMCCQSFAQVQSDMPIQIGPDVVCEAIGFHCP